MPLGCYSFCRGAKGPPSCCLPFPRCPPNGPSVCASVSVCLCVEARLQSFHSGVKRAKLVCMYVCVVPLGETEANSRKWIGMEGLARDSGVKMKEFFHTQRNSLSLFLSSLALSFCFRMHSLAPPLGLHWHMFTCKHKPGTCTTTHPCTHIHADTHTHTGKSRKYHQIFSIYTWQSLLKWFKV